MSSGQETSGAKPVGLRERTANATSAHIREELVPVIRALGKIRRSSSLVYARQACYWICSGSLGEKQVPCYGGW